MEKPPLDPDCADEAPSGRTLTPYDEAHLITYLRLLDAAKAGADWREAAKLVLHFDPEANLERARRAFDVLPYARPEPNIAGWQEVRDLISEAVTAVINKQQGPTEAARTLKKKADAVIAKT